jgi:hypothetical protein
VRPTGNQLKNLQAINVYPILLVALAVLFADQCAFSQSNQQLSAKPPTMPNLDSYLNMDPELLRTYSTDNLRKGEIEKAITQARQAVKLGSGNPLNHLILARALTAKFQTSGSTDVMLYAQAMDAWQFVRGNSQDSFDRDEAAEQLMRLRLERFTEKIKIKRRAKGVRGILMPKLESGF